MGSRAVGLGQKRFASFLETSGLDGDEGARHAWLVAITAITAVHRAIQALTLPNDGTSLRLFIVAATTSACVLILLRQFEVAALCIALAASTIRLVGDYPHSANHSFLETLLFLLTIILGARQSRQLVVMMPTVAGLVFVWSAIQKSLAGSYLTGATLAFFALEDSRFEALKVLGAAEAGGCYHAALPLRALSGLVVLAELVLGLAVCWQRTRKVAAIGCLLLLLGIEVFARELTFGGLMFALLLLSFKARWSCLGNYILAGLFTAGGVLAVVYFRS